MDCSQRRRGLEPFFLASCLLVSCRSTPLVVVTGVGQIEPIDFGRVIVGETSSATLKIENVQGNTFHLSAPPSIAGDDPSDFQLISDPPLTVTQGQSVSGLIAFSPQDAGPRSGQVSASTDSSTAAVVSGAVKGVGVAPETITLSVSPGALDFGQVEILTSVTLPVTLTNTGADPAPLLPLQASGPGQSAYSVALQGGIAAAPLPLAPGASLNLTVTFHPLVYGSLPAVLQIQACKLCAPLSVPLSGIGFTPGLVFLPPTLTYSAARGQIETQAVELLNQGNATGMITGLGFVENGALLDGGAFSVQFTQPLPTHLVTGQSLSFSVTYAPSLAEVAGEMDQVQLIAETSGANVQQTPGQLTGTVKSDCVLVIPPTLFLGYAVPPSFAPAQTLTIDNLGVDPCTLTQLAFALGSDPGFGFQVSPPATVVIPGFGSASLTLGFTPASASAPWLREGTLTMNTSDPAHPTASVALSGYTQSTPYANLSPWPRFCHDNGNSCLSEVDTSQTGPTLRWRTPIADCGELSPPGAYPGIYWQGPAIGGDGTIYELGCNGKLNALNPAGVIQWSTLAGGSRVTLPFADDNQVEDYLSFAMVPSVSAASQILVATLPPSGAVNQYFGFGSDGSTLWQAAPGPGLMASSPALRPDQSAMFTTYGGNTLSSAAGGTALPAVPCPTCWGTGVIAVDGTSYWMSAPALGPATVIQVLPDGGSGYSRLPPVTCGLQLTESGPTTMLMRGSEIYLSGNAYLDDGGTLTAVGAFEAADLTLDWQYCNSNDFIGSVVALGPDGAVLLTTLYKEFVGAYQAHIPSWYGFAWVDPPGTLRWENQTPPGQSHSYALPGFQNFPAIGAEGTVYFTSDTAALIALSSVDGSILWSYSLDGGTIGTSPPAIAADGTIYFQDSDGYLDAVR